MTAREAGLCSDLVVLGGGPAGCAAALTVLTYSRLKVTLVERSRYEDWRVGETLSPAVLPLLHYLGAEETLQAEQQLASYGTAAAWGAPDVVARDFLFSAAGEGWQLDRARFDRALADLVCRRGGTVHLGTTVTEEAREDDRWRLVLTDGTILSARYVIDASGRQAAFARRRGAIFDVRDHLAGAVALFPDDGSCEAGTLVEATPWGWWYTARLPAERRVVALMTDSDILRKRRLHEPAHWLTALAETQAIRQRLSTPEPLGPPVVRAASSQILEPLSGDGWIAAGEATVGFDPLSSMGIGYALASGIQAARIAAGKITGGPDATSDAPADSSAVDERGTTADAPELDEASALFAADVRRHFDAYLDRRRAYYLREPRWRDQAFWSRRM
ncbi:MAG TPA: tryptophan 7-halogenase [Thermoanaerobaculia bacterium]|jgi:flavin-dependent dehydrogenase|nr:tryptophan 7-halogenase [Thermoanaerobaculia bacterium]